jgi:dihydroorotate dehydrogenase
MAGADVTMLCSALMRYGITHIQRIEMDLVAWLEQHHRSLPIDDKRNCGELPIYCREDQRRRGNLN